jgi:hypothetical protein
MSAQFTPAPWAFERALEANGSVTFDIFNSATEACNRSGECVAYIQTYSEQEAAVQEANARLIAAAPDLLAALLAAYAYVPPSSPVHQQIAAAIAQARGQS